MNAQSGAERSGRLHWLDLARILCALMILGIHWLRAGYKVGLFGAGDPVNLVMDYQSHSGGLRLFDYVLIAGTGPHPSTWLTNSIGLLGGFGWEAVSALILISGFSLAISQGGKMLARADWFVWYGRHAKRILVPFYLVALSFLTLYVLAVVAIPHVHGRFASVIDEKLLSQFHTPLLGVIVSHLFLIDPYNKSWSADFFAPAWWFVPAILLAYVAYPFVRGGSRFGRGIPILIGAALLSMAAFAAADAGILVNESWYYIVLQESFNFTLGVVIANAWLGSARPALERAMSDPRVCALALAVFVLGNIANWTPALRSLASMLYGPSLVVMIVFAATCLARSPWARKMTVVDPYDLYLVHQPFAFPLALAAKFLFHGYAVFAGWFVFVAVASLAAIGLSRVRSMISVRGPATGGRSVRSLSGERVAS
jgi:hypothetical protein